jgi:GntR family transcriptional regulator, rspAB operon transcriptional repressor
VSVTEQASGPSRLRVQGILRQEIINGTLPPGEPLYEVQLAKRLHVSRTPVREALQSLDRDGLVRIVPGKGAFVSHITFSDVVELFQLRVALEGCAARLAATSPTRGEVACMIPKLEAARVLVRGGGADSYYKTTSELDHAIVALVENGRLADMLSDLWRQTARLRRLAKLSPQRLSASIDEHLAIIDAISRGDENAAEEATRIHLSNSRDNILGLLNAPIR